MLSERKWVLRTLRYIPTEFRTKNSASHALALVSEGSLGAEDLGVEFTEYRGGDN